MNTQKVVAIYLASWQRAHLFTEELFAEHLAQGWRVASLSTSGGAADAHGVGVWVVAVLEQPAE